MALECGFMRMRGERSEGDEGENFKISLNFLAFFCDIREKRSVFNGF